MIGTVGDLSIEDDCKWIHLLLCTTYTIFQSKTYKLTSKNQGIDTTQEQKKRLSNASSLGF